MLEQEADKNWIISRWLDEVEAKARNITPEVYTNVSRTYQHAYIQAVLDFKDFLRQIGTYVK